MNKPIIVEDEEVIEGIETEKDGPMVSSDPYADKVWVDAEINHETQSIESSTQETPLNTSAGASLALLDAEESKHFRERWNEIQSHFVDEPRSAVQQADVLVSEVIEKITEMFANEHALLENQWNQGQDVSTEDLRRALQQYRSFFNRLVV